jgi:hypothetical protein
VSKLLSFPVRLNYSKVLPLLKYHYHDVRKEVEVKLHTFLTSALDEDD